MFVLMTRLFAVLAEIEKLTALLRQDKVMLIRRQQETVTHRWVRKDGSVCEMTGLDGELYSITGVIVALSRGRFNCISKQHERFWNWYWRASEECDVLHQEAISSIKRSYC